jgi:hypothetical protein
MLSLCACCAWFRSRNRAELYFTRRSTATVGLHIPLPHIAGMERVKLLRLQPRPSPGCKLIARSWRGIVLRSDGYCDVPGLLERRAAQEARLIAFDLLRSRARICGLCRLASATADLSSRSNNSAPASCSRKRLPPTGRQCSDAQRNWHRGHRIQAAGQGLSSRPNQALAQDQIRTISAVK